MGAVHFAKLRVPCSTSNLGPGYDSIGLALGLWNEFAFERIPSGIEIVLQGHGADSLERGENSRAYRAFCAVYERMNEALPGVRIVQRNNVPLARGLGGSATAVLAGTTAGLLFSGMEASPLAVLNHSIAIETHPDNLTPSLVGGLTVSLMNDGHVAYLKVTPPSELTTVILIPDRGLVTGAARRVVPETFSRDDVVFNIRGAAMLMTALALGDLSSLSLAMRDRLHQPYRLPLLPGMTDIFNAALYAGSPGVALSGAGSGIFAFAYRENAEKIGAAMQREAREHGIGACVLHLPIDGRGLQIVSTG